MKILHFQVKLTSRYHTSRPGVLGVKVVDVVGQLCTELSVKDGEVSKVVVMVMILMKMNKMTMKMVLMMMMLLMKTICLGSVQLTIGPTVFWSLHSPS